MICKVSDRGDLRGAGVSWGQGFVCSGGPGRGIGSGMGWSGGARRGGGSLISTFAWLLTAIA